MGKSACRQFDQEVLPVTPGTSSKIRQLPVQNANCKDRSGYEGSTAFAIYLREIGRVKLLTREQEIAVSKRLKRGDESAREEMIKANLRLVVTIARDFENAGLPLLDLVSEGNTGLIKAVERFDAGQGCRFSTYAAWWVKQAIKRALADQSRTIRLPVYLVDKIAKLRRSALQLRSELHREPTPEELGVETGLSARKVTQLLNATFQFASLDAISEKNGDRSLGDLIPDESLSPPDAVLDDRIILEVIWDLVKRLHPRERQVLRLRFGLDGEPSRTLEVVGREVGVSCERVRQIQNTALKTLRRMLEKMESALPRLGGEGNS